MFNNYFKTGYIAFFVMVLFVIFSLCVYTPIFSLNSDISLIAMNPRFYSVDSEFAWPVPTSYKISSYFGYRTSPTWGASNYHSGIDIAANTGCDIISILSGTVVFTDFYGSAGYTVMIKSDDITILYSHVSPNFLVYLGETVIKGQVIAKVGPKNVYGVINNKFKDSDGNPTNGATTGPHLHLTIKKDGIAVNPLNYFPYSSSL